MSENTQECDCGWLLPQNVTVAISGEEVKASKDEVVITITCPTCGSSFTMNPDQKIHATVYETERDDD